MIDFVTSLYSSKVTLALLAKVARVTISLYLSNSYIYRIAESERVLELLEFEFLKMLTISL